MPSPFEESSGILKRAVLAGALGAAAMSITVVLFALARGVDPWLSIKAPSAILYLQRSVEPGFDAAPAAVGLLIHLGVCVVWAVVFGYLLHGLPAAAMLALGPLWGVLAGAVMSLAVLPLFELTRLRADMPLGPTTVAYLVFGAAVGATFAVRKRLPRQSPQPA
jgi:hypothetical protein